MRFAVQRDVHAARHCPGAAAACRSPPPSGSGSAPACPRTGTCHRRAPAPRPARRRLVRPAPARSDSRPRGVRVRRALRRRTVGGIDSRQDRGGGSRDGCGLRAARLRGPRGLRRPAGAAAPARRRDGWRRTAAAEAPATGGGVDLRGHRTPRCAARTRTRRSRPASPPPPARATAATTTSRTPRCRRRFAIARRAARGYRRSAAHAGRSDVDRRPAAPARAALRAASSSSSSPR